MSAAGPEPELAPVRAEDAEELARLVAECFAGYAEFAPPGWAPPDHADGPERIRDRLALAGGRGVIAWEEGRDLGHVLWMAASESRLEGRDRTVAYLWQLFVAAPWRGRPLAGRLLAWAVADAAARGFDSMELLTPRPHARARRFYEREGWTLAGPGGWDAELRMELVLYRRGLRRE